MNSELKKALIYSWILVSFGLTISILIPFVDTNKAVLSNVPTCISIQKNGTKCILCGSSRAYYLIAERNFQEAWTINKIAVMIFGMSILNTILLLAVIIKLIYSNKNLITFVKSN